MEKNKKKWIKYAGVVLAFTVMAGVFVPQASVEVNAMEMDGSVSDNEIITVDWTITVKYDIGEGAEWNGTSENILEPLSGIYYLNVSENVPQKDGFQFLGWVKDSDTSNVYSPGSSIEIDGSKTNESTVVLLTAQWEWDGKSLTESGKSYSLIKETPYMLGEGKWTVNDDGYSYISGANGSTIYVETEGTYTFTKN